ncbi:MAG: ATP-binding protein [Chloroflexi bacterium]|nr:ATP-binding protein [Chloroflexota bacterium]
MAIHETMPAAQPSFAARALHMPALYKILIANSLIIAIGAVAGTVITVLHVQMFPDDVHYELIAIFAAAGLLISFAANYFTVKIALQPLDRLQAAVDQVRRGTRAVTVSTGPVSDERFDQLAGTFNQMISALEADARQMRRLSAAILRAQEDERQRVARELHDETAQALTSLLVRLRLLERAADPAEAQAHLQELRQLTAQALDEVRRVALELRPKILDDLGLGAALAWRVDELNALHGARATLQISGSEARLPREVELVFYRVAQEGLTNAVRHAQANQIKLALKREGGRLSLVVEDNGRGFDVGAMLAQPGRGLGLLGMKERLALIGGEMTIESRPGGGTRLMASTPLTPAPIVGGGAA